MEKCIICNNETSSNEYYFCKDCYRNNVKSVRENFDHNRSEYNIRNHYFNLKKNIAEQNNESRKESLCLMYALAEELDLQFEDDYLLYRVDKDFEEILELPEIEENDIINDEDIRNKWPREIRCDDGHYVRSLSEKNIDDWLYHNNIVHAYEKSVYMDTVPEAIVLSDFYLPEGNVYIEFWGLEEQEQYNQRKEEKIRLYDENEYNRIDLNQNDIKRLDDIMPRKLSKYIKRKK